MKDRTYDIITLGGGVAGCACAYMSAKLGLKSLLVEKNNYLGGLATGALVVPMMKSERAERETCFSASERANHMGEAHMKSATKGLNTEFFNDLISYAKKFGAQITYDDNDGWFDPVMLKVVLEDILASVGADILYEAIPVSYANEDKKIKSIEVDTLTLSLPFYSKYFVDATGNANFAKLLNCEFWQDTEQKQPSSLRFILSGVNVKEFADFIMELDANRDVTTSFEIDGRVHFSTSYTWDSSKHSAMAPFFDAAVKEGELKLSDTDYFQVFTVAGVNDSVAFNCPRIKEDLSDSEFASSKGLIEARGTIFRLLNFCKKYLKGFQNAYISNIADMTGVREFRRVKCRYDYTIDDIYSQKTFENAVLHSDYPVDIHSTTKGGSTLREVRPYSLPLESLMSKDYDNLYAIGRCLGADFKAQAALRVQPSCMSMGEATARDVALKTLYTL